MNKKFLISLITVFLLISFACLSFAIESTAELAEQEGSDAVNTVRNVVGGAENAVENAANNISNSSRDMTENIENRANEMTNSMTNKLNDNNNNDYMAVRTSTNENGETTLMGMTATTWTWIIMAIAAAVIIGLVWYYTSQSKDKYDSND